MTEPGDNCVIVCESVHDVMALERALKDAQIKVEMVPTPRALTSDCGMALEVPAADMSRIAALKADRQLAWRGAFIRATDGFTQVG